MAKTNENVSGKEEERSNGKPRSRLTSTIATARSITTLTTAKAGSASFVSARGVRHADTAFFLYVPRKTPLGCGAHIQKSPPHHVVVKDERY